MKTLDGQAQSNKQMWFSIFVSKLRYYNVFLEFNIHICLANECMYSLNVLVLVVNLFSKYKFILLAIS